MPDDPLSSMQHTPLRAPFPLAHCSTPHPLLLLPRCGALNSRHRPLVHCSASQLLLLLLLLLLGRAHAGLQGPRAVDVQWGHARFKED